MRQNNHCNGEEEVGQPVKPYGQDGNNGRDWCRWSNWKNEPQQIVRQQVDAESHETYRKRQANVG
jgi:hypothetical protein